MSLTVTLTYDGSATAPTAVGSYNVVATISDANYTGTASGTLAVAKGAATVVLGALAQTYDGSARIATATTTPAGLTVNVTYDGSPTPPTAAGSYAVVGTVSDASYEGSAAGTLVVAKAAATVTLGALAQTFDSTPRPATAATTPAGLTVSLTYNGTDAAPTGAGSYLVVGTISDNNYAGTATGTLAVAKAAAGVALAGLAPTYDGSPKSVTATTTPAGLSVSFTYNGSAVAPTVAGGYPVVATINDANYEGTAAGTLTIAKATATVTLGGLAQSFDGTPKMVTATTTPAGLTVGITYGGSARAPSAGGSYAVVATVNAANYTGSAADTLVVGKGAATATLAGLTQNYNGAPKSVTATTVPAGLPVTFTYNGSPTAPTAVGSYAVVATVNSPNYAGFASGTLVIAKGVPTIAFTTPSYIYNGTPRAATATTTPAGLPVTFTYGGSPTLPVNAGTYTVVATVNTANYTGTATGTLTIAKAPAGVFLGNLYQTYNGALRMASAATAPGGLPVLLTYNGSATAPTNAGDYTLVGTINHPNYAGAATGLMRVFKATATVRVSATTQPYTGAPQAATATTSPVGLPVTLRYNGSPSAPTNIGTYAVVGTINHPNYAGSGEGRLSITRATVAITIGNLTQTYTGALKPVTATTVPAGLPVAFLYNGSSMPPSGAGTYSVTATVNMANYTGSSTGTLTINKATAAVTFSTLAQTYDGMPKAALASTTPAGLAFRATYNGSSTAPAAVGTYAVATTVTDSNYTGSAVGTLTIVNGGPTIRRVTPNTMVGGTGGITISVVGRSFTASSVVRFGSTALVTTFVNAANLTAVIPAGLVPSPANGINIVPITVLNGGVISASWLFTVTAASVSQLQTTGAAPGQTVTAATPPAAPGQPGLSATYAHSGQAAQTATVTTAVYGSNPVAGTGIDTGGGIVDLQITGADPTDRATVRFYYSSNITGAAEANLILRYFNGTTWAPIQTDGGGVPAKNTNDYIDKTVSGGRFTVVFSNTSTPKITELSGTIIAMSVNRVPVAAAGADQTVDATTGDAAFVTLNGTASADADGEELTYEWRNGRKVLGIGASLLTSLEVGTHTLTLEVTDAAGKSSTDTVKVTVRDVLAPTLVLPTNLVRNTKRSDGRKVRYDVDVSDLSTRYRDIKLTYSHRSGSRFPVGTTTVTVTAKDEAGNIATGTFTIIVLLKADNDEDDDNGSCDDDDDDDRDHNHRGDRDHDRGRDDDGRRD